MEFIMIREIVKPNDSNLVIYIPDEYIVFPLHKNSKKKQNQDVDIDAIDGILNHYADPSKLALEDKA
jgi:hypothetical protein